MMSSKFLRLKKSKYSKDLLDVYADNGVLLGQFLKKEDGFYDFWPEDRGGYWPSYLLRALADELDLLNAEWQKDIEDYFNKELEKENNNETV